MPMHEKFADWYRRADLNPTPEVLQRRWACVEALAQGLNAQAVLASVRLFVGAPMSDARERCKAFVEILKAADSTFPMEGNDTLMHVMLGSTAACILAQGGARALVAGLALRTSNCQGIGLRAELDILGEAEKFLSSEGLSARHRATAPVPEPAVAAIAKAPQGKASAAAKAEGKANLVEVTDISHANANDKALGAALTEVAGVVETLRSTLGSLQQRVRQQDARAEVLKEESEVLWWLFSGRSATLGVDFSALPSPGGSLVVAKELAARTYILPAPPSLDAFLLKALGGSGTTVCSIGQLVNSLQRAWVEPVAASATWTHRNGLTPVHAALQLSVDLDSADWLPVLTKATLLRGDGELSCAAWARQFYDELLLGLAVSRAQA
jgi:GTPase-associated system helical domain